MMETTRPHGATTQNTALFRRYSMLPCPQEPTTGPCCKPDEPSSHPSTVFPYDPSVTFRVMLFFFCELSPPNSRAGGQPLRCLPLPLAGTPPYLEAVSSIRNVRTRYAVGTRGPLHMGDSTGKLSSTFIVRHGRLLVGRWIWRDFVVVTAINAKADLCPWNYELSAPPPPHSP
jgi:hypothetical protein